MGKASVRFRGSPIGPWSMERTGPGSDDDSEGVARSSRLLPGWIGSKTGIATRCSLIGG